MIDFGAESLAVVPILHLVDILPPSGSQRRVTVERQGDTAMNELDEIEGRLRRLQHDWVRIHSAFATLLDAASRIRSIREGARLKGQLVHLNDRLQQVGQQFRERDKASSLRLVK